MNTISHTPLLRFERLDRMPIEELITTVIHPFDPNRSFHRKKAMCLATQNNQMQHSNSNLYIGGCKTESSITEGARQDRQCTLYDNADIYFVSNGHPRTREAFQATTSATGLTK